MATPVTLHIYDLNADMNKGLRLLGTGAFHSAVEVNGLEWSYGFSEFGTGVFSCPPRQCAGAEYREAIAMGRTELSEAEVNAVIEDLKRKWSGVEYDLLRHNCCVFSNAMCLALGAGPIPTWVTNLAAAGATLGDGILKAASVTTNAAIVAAAKAGEINAKYQITGKAQAKAQDFIAAAQGLDRQYRIRETAGGVASKAAETAGGVASKVVMQAGELNRQYKITQKAGEVASTVATQAVELDRTYRIQEGLQRAATTAASRVSETVQAAGRQSVAASQASMASAQASAAAPPSQAHGGAAGKTGQAPSDGCLCS